jgi:ribonuclease BN (tRNA processing enzyme)
MTTRIFFGTNGKYMDVKLTVIGCSPAWNNPGGANSGYLVDAGTRVLLDCGPGVLAKLRERESWPVVDALVISHLHLDHWGDLIPWVWGSLFGPGTKVKQPALFLPPGAQAALRPVLAQLGSEDMLRRAFDVHEYGESEAFEIAGCTVLPRRVPHYKMNCYGFRVENGAVSIAYSADSGPSSALEDLARDVDLFVCEATLERGDSDGDLRGHLSAEEAVAAYDASGARRLLITHRPSELPLDNGLELAHDGLELIL